MIMGLQDPWVAVAFLACIFSTLLCLAWGVARWNAREKNPEPDSEIKQWASEEDKVEEEL